MTERQKLEANEKRDAIFCRCGWVCEVCGRPLREGVPQLAHRISKSKMNISMYGQDVIHHEFNLAPVCSLLCNSSVLLDRKLEQKENLLDRIYADLKRGK
jgi:hypothetical protein